MKRSRTVFLFLAATAVSVFFSCASSTEAKTDSVYAMVYDYDNSEVMNVSICIDGKEAGKTDIYGRLMFPPDGDGEHIITASKEDYETVEMRAAIRPGQLLYFRIGSASYYAERAEQLFDGNDEAEALKMVDKALEIKDRKDWRFLRDVITGSVKNEK